MMPWRHIAASVASWGDPRSLSATHRRYEAIIGRGGVLPVAVVARGRRHQGDVTIVWNSHFLVGLCLIIAAKLIGDAISSLTG
jgi:hypothetical protein